jgi:hypothetical protein
METPTGSKWRQNARASYRREYTAQGVGKSLTWKEREPNDTELILRISPESCDPLSDDDDS